MISWEKTFETGFSTIDQEHRTLVEALNSLEFALREGKGRETLPQLVAFLEEYAGTHFRNEEGCMARNRCPAAAANKAAHAEFLALFGHAKQQLIDSKGSAATSVAITLHREMANWIRRHILTVDSALKACVRKSA